MAFQTTQLDDQDETLTQVVLFLLQKVEYFWEKN